MRGHKALMQVKVFSEQVSAVQLCIHVNKPAQFFWTMPAFGFLKKQVNFLLMAAKWCL